MLTGQVEVDSGLYDRVRDFLFDEADLIDRWKLQEWVDMFAPDGWYYIPNLDAEDPETADPDVSLFIAADSRAHLLERIKRMASPAAYAENPRSQVLHSLSNIRITDVANEELRVRAHFLVHRSRYAKTISYFGTVYYRLHLHNSRLLIREKRACLAVGQLGPQGSISILL